MLNVPKPNDYLICTSEAHTLQEFIDKLFIKLGLDSEKFVKFDKSFNRPVELEKIYGNPQKAKTELELLIIF